MSKITELLDMLRFWMIKQLAGDSAIAINLPLLRGLYIDSDKMKRSYFYKVSISNLDGEQMPDDVGYYFYKAPD